MTAPADIGAETPVLEVKSLTVELPKGTDRQFAVEEISFAVRPREIVCWSANPVPANRCRRFR